MSSWTDAVLTLNWQYTDISESSLKALLKLKTEFKLKKVYIQFTYKYSLTYFDIRYFDILYIHSLSYGTEYFEKCNSVKTII